MNTFKNELMRIILASVIVAFGATMPTVAQEATNPSAESATPVSTSVKPSKTGSSEYHKWGVYGGYQYLRLSFIKLRKEPGNFVLKGF